MSCYICHEEAVTRCYNCGELVCAVHGKGESCPQCNSGIMAGDPRGGEVSAKPFGRKPQHRWWRPQRADEYQPPACYQCQGLSRAVCRNCHCNYCGDHAGPGGLCQACDRSARLGSYVLVAILGAALMVFAWNWLLGG